MIRWYCDVLDGVVTMMISGLKKAVLELLCQASLTK